VRAKPLNPRESQAHKSPHSDPNRFCAKSGSWSYKRFILEERF
jgi:hypothetical protein